MNKTIAEQLDIKDFPFEIKDKNGKQIYYENSNGSWYKYEYDQNGNQIYFESSTGFWVKYEYDQNSKIIYSENSNGYWRKDEYDQNGNQIYYEYSNGYWVKYEYDQNGKIIYYENSNGYWEKRKYDQNGNKIYFENSNDYIIDNRPKVVELTIDQIATKLNIDEESKAQEYPESLTDDGESGLIPEGQEDEWDDVEQERCTLCNKVLKPSKIKRGTCDICENEETDYVEEY